jgi:hypothetical protein
MGNPVLSRTLGVWLAGFSDGELPPETPNGSPLRPTRHLFCTGRSSTIKPAKRFFSIDRCETMIATGALRLRNFLTYQQAAIYKPSLHS